MLTSTIASAAATIRLETVHDPARNRDVPIKLFLPSTLDKPAPIVICSPGLGGSRDGHDRLGESAAAAGYVVVVLTHVGSDIKVFTPGSGLTPQAVMTMRELADRVADVRFVVDRLTQWNAGGDALTGKLDLSRLAMAGHSYGAVTTQAIMCELFAGQSLADPRFCCGILMSPSPPRLGDPAAAFAKVDRPLLHLTGTADDSPINDMKAADRRVVFDQCPAKSQTLVIFKDGDHMLFGSRKRLLPAKAKLDAALRPLIDTLIVKFLDANLRDDAAAAEWMKATVPTFVGTFGTVEQK